MVIDHNHPYIKRLHNQPGFQKNRYNGAYYYSKEIAKFFIPYIKTDRNWVTINVPKEALPHAIVFAHNNVHLEWYEKYKGLDPVFVCGMPETAERLKMYGETIYLPLSIDTEYVSKFRTEKTKEACFVGRREKLNDAVPKNIDILESMPRPALLAELARYRKAYAVDRCAIEAKCLGCEVIPYGYGYGVVHPVDFWKVIDSRDAAKMLQKKLNEVDHEDTEKDQRV